MTDKTKTILAGFQLSEHWREIFGKLNAEDGPLDIRYWIYFKRNEDEIRIGQETFKDTSFHYVLDATRSIGALPLDEPCLDESELMALSRFEPIAITMMDRLDPDNCFTYAERKRFYNRLLKYWMAVIERCQPKLIIFPQAPHMVYDYVLYILAQQADIKILMFSVNSALGRVMLGTDMEDFCVQVQNAYQRGARIDSDDDIEVINNHINKLQQDYGIAKPHYMKMIEHSNNDIKFNFSSDPITLLKAIYWKSVLIGLELRQQINLRIPIGAALPESYVKQKEVALENSHYNLRDWQRVKRSEIRKKKRLKAQYNAFATDHIDATLKYVYVPLHYQPETTTCPEGGYYMDQLLMIEMISKMIPDDWVIYVKEHYLQWQIRVSKGHQSRHAQYYDDLVLIPKVRLVSMSVDSFKLMDSCRLLATVLGYAAWEAMVRGKPAFLFGAPWFGAYKNAYLIKTKQDFHDAFSQVEDGSSISTDEDIRAYLEAYFSVSFKGFTSKWNVDMVDLNEQQNIDNFSHALTSFLNHDTINTP